MIQISFTPVVKQSASTIQCGEILSEGTFLILISYGSVFSRVLAQLALKLMLIENTYASKLVF